MQTLNIKTNHFNIIQVREFGPVSHWGNELTNGARYIKDIRSYPLRWYRAESFMITDLRVAKYERMLDRLTVLEQLANDEFLEVDWSISDYQKEYRLFWDNGNEYSDSIQNDLEEYQHYVNTFVVDDKALLADLIDESIEREL